MIKKNLSFNSLFKWAFRFITLTLMAYHIIMNTNNMDINYILNGILILICSFAPDLILRLVKYKISNSADLLIQIFIFLSMFLGRMYHFYSLISCWDLFLHLISGVVLGFLSLSLLKNLATQNVFEQLSPLLIFLFILLSIVSSAALWEFWEFAGDQLFGFDSQFNSLVDTMSDMIIGTIGGLPVAILGYFHCKNGSFKFLTGFINSFTKI
ncbi:MAG: hypothetical protein RSA29_02505 [Clostridium sp.]|uniref:hypothetical protein n=2 Tax=Clostridium sp. TaxID=1506 RepID=UPI003024FB3A